MQAPYNLNIKIHSKHLKNGSLFAIIENARDILAGGVGGPHGRPSKENSRSHDDCHAMHGPHTLD